MNKKFSLIIGLQAFIIILMFWMIVFYGKDEYEAYRHEQEEEVESPNRVSVETGITMVTVTPEALKQSGITTAHPVASQATSTLPALGQVIALDALIELRTRYLAAEAEANLASASLFNTTREYERLKTLNEDDKNISDRAVTLAEAAWRADQARLSAAESSARALKDNMRQAWGSTLAEWFTAQASKEAQGLLQHTQVLLRVTYPFDVSPAIGERIRIRPIGANAGYQLATLVSPAPQADNLAQGKTYYYQAPANEMRAGMRLNVITDGTESKKATGVIIPADAVIWYGGKAWVYKKTEGDKFTRQPISTAQPVEGGWFNQASLLAEDEIVTSGAQLLLSEEFKYQIKNENED